MSSSKLPEGWKISEPYSESKNSKYVKRMYEETIAAGHPPPKVIPTFASEEEKQAHIFNMQAPSTKAALEAQKKRKPEEDLEHLLRPMPACIANPEAKDHDSLVGTRKVSPEEILIAERARRSAKNELGSSKESSVQGEKRDKGIHAFTFSKPHKPTLEEIKKLKKILGIEGISPDFSPKQQETKKKKSFWQRLMFWKDDRESRPLTKDEWNDYFGKN